MASSISYIYFSDGVTLTESGFGRSNGEAVKKFTWKTENGLEIAVISYGASIQAIRIPDKNGVVKDVALGFDDVESYVTLNTPDLLGCVIGRCAARIVNAEFTIDGETFHLTKNLDPHHLHGGTAGFDKANWKSTIEGTKVILSHLSRDGDQGYPGDLIVNVSYELKNDGTFHVNYQAVTNKKTVVNLSNHSYFNLAGHETGIVGLKEHTVIINSDKILEGDKDWIPTGRFVEVGGTPYDLRVANSLRERINNDEDDIRYHDNYVVNRVGTQGLTFVARVEHPPSGRYMEVHSDQPSVIFYTGNYMQGAGHPDLIGKGGILYGRSGGLCLEPMNLVDAIHHPHFPSPILSPGEVYQNRNYFTFGVKS